MSFLEYKLFKLPETGISDKIQSVPTDERSGPVGEVLSYSDTAVSGFSDKIDLMILFSDSTTNNIPPYSISFRRKISKFSAVAIGDDKKCQFSTIRDPG